ncbi:hypothetical protein WJX84_011580 [Apatococcus fuscideae]|uniref:UspA domain-containing protein n=1 Tax=Apatococcus fuscideae TaxID=2026836 RepID=A0AAW1SW79_9CHLO
MASTHIVVVALDNGQVPNKLLEYAKQQFDLEGNKIQLGGRPIGASTNRPPLTSDTSRTTIAGMRAGYRHGPHHGVDGGSDYAVEGGHGVGSKMDGGPGIIHGEYGPLIESDDYGTPAGGEGSRPGHGGKSQAHAQSSSGILESGSRPQEEMAEMEVNPRDFLVTKVAPKLALQKAFVEVVILRAANETSEAIGSAICKYAEQVQAVTLVMMRNARPWLKEKYVGSVTSQCMQKSNVPLTIIFQ